MSAIEVLKEMKENSNNLGIKYYVKALDEALLALEQKEKIINICKKDISFCKREIKEELNNKYGDNIYDLVLLEGRLKSYEKIIKKLEEGVEK